MKVDIICPLYNAEKYIYNLNSALLMQKDVSINNIKYILTKSNDSTQKILDQLELKYELIEKKDFSHSLVREKAIYESDADIICLISQDIVIENDDWLKNLIQPIIDGEVEATYSRQMTKFDNIEKYTREYNYPDVSIVKSKDDVINMGLNTFFFSDASSAIKRDVFIKLEGYDHKNLPINEDMYYAYKLIMNEYKIKYCADSVVFHSHDFKLSELYNRYKLTGLFFKENSYLNKYNTNKSGKNMAKYILRKIKEEKRLDLLFRYPFDMAARYFGLKAGER